MDENATAVTRKRYGRTARFYDLMQLFSERRSGPWRDRLWKMASGPRILEVGVGTGLNIPRYPEDAEITAIDLTPGMLDRALRKAQALKRKIDLRLGDVQRLEYPDGAFDTVVATCVFCSVPDARLGLTEVKRVARPGGKVLLLEHQRARSERVGKIMDLLNPFMVRMMGANINRRTVDNVRAAGLEIDRVEDLDKLGIFKLIIAHA